MNLFTIPNLLTLTNLFCGCASIVCIFTGKIHLVPYLVLLAALCDFLDGFVARLLKSSSDIGEQLDSLADMVTFGVVPGLIFYHLLGVYTNNGIWLPFFGFLVTLAAALRLAKFNVDDRQTEGFMGLATPACTMYVIGLLGMLLHGGLFQMEIVSEKLFLIPNIIILAYLQISDVPMFSFKKLGKGWKGNEIVILFLISSVLLIGFLQYLGLAISVFLYIILSVVNNFKK